MNRPESPERPQETADCDVPSHQGISGLTLSNGDRLVTYSRPVFRCSGGTRITTDSARVYESTQYFQLFGHVAFGDGNSRLTADEAQYFGADRRLRAWGNAVLTNDSAGSVIRGDTMVLIRAGENRPEDSLTVTGTRPHATLYPAPVAEPAQDTASEVVAPPDTLAAGGPPVPDSARGGRIPPDSVGAGAEAQIQAPEAPPTPEAQGAEEEEERIPYEIDARRIVVVGSRSFRAVGSVVVTRDSLTASADSVEYAESGGTLALERNAKLETSSYDLTARHITLVIPDNDVKEVRAREDAVLVGEDLRLLAPVISLFLESGTLDRLVAVRGPEADSLEAVQAEGRPPRPPPDLPVEEAAAETPVGAESEGPSDRPHAIAENFSLVADSLEVLSPKEVLDEVKAVGRARGESMGRDSLNTPETSPLIRHDWLEGDTIIATFVRRGDSLPVPGDSLRMTPDSEVVRDEPDRPRPIQEAAPPDSTQSEYEIKRLVAQGNARSLYRLAASDSSVVAEGGPPAAHYVVGNEITILLDQGEVERMEVQGQVMGIHLEPLAPGKKEEGKGGGAGGGGQGGRR